MEKLFLVLHEYDCIGPAIYIVKQENLNSFTSVTKHRKTTVFLFDVKELKKALQEVEVVTTVKPILK